MKTFSSAIALFSALAPLAAVPAVNAQEIHTDGQVLGYPVQFIVEGRTRSDVDVLAIKGPRGIETIKVTCSPFVWEAQGPNTADTVDAIARAWCF